jgi:hypothetical protein
MLIEFSLILSLEHHHSFNSCFLFLIFSFPSYLLLFLIFFFFFKLDVDLLIGTFKQLFIHIALFFFFLRNIESRRLNNMGHLIWFSLKSLLIVVIFLFSGRNLTNHEKQVFVIVRNSNKLSIMHEYTKFQSELCFLV